MDFAGVTRLASTLQVSEPFKELGLIRVVGSANDSGKDTITLVMGNASFSRETLVSMVREAATEIGITLEDSQILVDTSRAQSRGR